MVVFMTERILKDNYAPNVLTMQNGTGQKENYFQFLYVFSSYKMTWVNCVNDMNRDLINYYNSKTDKYISFSIESWNFNAHSFKGWKCIYQYI